MDLSGTWRAAPADDELRRSAIGLDVNDDGWERVPVPGHWRSVPAFAESDGPMLYRTTFEQPVPEPGERRWVVLDGIFYQGDVWLDGAYLGDPEGYFVPHAYDVTALCRLGNEHALAVEVTCSPQTDKRAKRNITGVFQHWDCIRPGWNPGGIWRPVRIESTGAVRIDRLRVLCRDADESRAHLRLHARFDSETARSVRLMTWVDGQLAHADERTLAHGVNDHDWTVDVEHPRLWWPWALGEPQLTDVAVEVLVDGQPSHRLELRTGLREVAMQGWKLSVNGEQLFVKGANLAPTRTALADASAEELRRDIGLARDAGLDMVRVHAHISRPELYDAADEAGMLVWQDFPLQWGYARQVRRQAVRQAEEAVYLLGHHPSIAVWCGHNEPFRIDLQPGAPLDTGKLVVTLAAANQLPTWNKSVLDRWVKRTFERSDDTRPVVAHSGVLPHLPQLDGTDSHLYFGWFHGDERDLPGFAATVPRLVRFVSEFGAQAVPTEASFMEPRQWPHLDWVHLATRYGMQAELFSRYVPSAEHDTFASWQQASQEYQAILVKHHVETLRRLKYRPTGGFCVYMLNDAEPMVSCSVLDHERQPKQAFHALAEACAPVIVVGDRLPVECQPDDALALDVHVVSDLRCPLTDAVVTATLNWPGGTQHWQWQGDIGADDCVRVGTVKHVVPDVEGPLVLDLTLVAGDVVATNRDHCTITRRAD